MKKLDKICGIIIGSLIGGLVGFLLAGCYLCALKAIYIYLGGLK